MIFPFRERYSQRLNEYSAERGKIYDSPSAAAQEVKIDNGAPENVTENGWLFWKYSDENGNPKKINELRK